MTIPWSNSLIFLPSSHWLRYMRIHYSFLPPSGAAQSYQHHLEVRDSIWGVFLFLLLSINFWRFFIFLKASSVGAIRVIMRWSRGWEHSEPADVFRGFPQPYCKCQEICAPASPHYFSNSVIVEKTIFRLADCTTIFTPTLARSWSLLLRRKLCL